MREGKNTCPWLKRLRTKTCGRSCMEEYCAIHRQLIRRGPPIPVPCQECGIGTQSKTRLCNKFGQHTAKDHLRRKEAKARRCYSLVIDEVKAGNFHLKRHKPSDICTEVPCNLKERHEFRSRRPPKRNGSPANPSP